jgi:hypothetical protein
MLAGTAWTHGLPGPLFAAAPTNLHWQSNASCLNLDSLMNVARLPEGLFNRIQLWSAGADIHAGGPVLASARYAMRGSK